MVTSVLVAFGLNATSAFAAETGLDYGSVHDYASSVVFTLSGIGVGPVENYPLPIRLKVNSPEGFTYDLLRNGADDIRFFDAAGQALSFDVERWVPNGESLIWVCVPIMRNGDEIRMCWNLRDGCRLPEVDPTRVWSGYAGIWHFGESITADAAAATRSADATGHGLDIVATNVVENGVTAGNVRQMVSTTGAFGNGRVNATTCVAKGNRLVVPSYDSYGLGSQFTVSFWMKAWKLSGLVQLLNRKATTGSGAGWQLESPDDNSNRCNLTVRGGGLLTSQATLSVFDANPVDIDEYLHVALVFNDTQVSVYNNGVLRGTGTVVAPTDNGLPLLIGGGERSEGSGTSFAGAIDELRLIGGVRSAELLALDYAIATNAFYTAGAISNDTSAVLQNSWTRVPSISKTIWTAGTHPTWNEIDVGQPAHGTCAATFYDRRTGTHATQIPTAVGDYRVIITVAAGNGWGALSYELGFRIVSDGGTHAFTSNVAHILLLNDDYSVDGGEVEWQSYDDEDGSLGLPYWKHLDENGNNASTSYDDYWSESLEFNLGGGTHHIYRQGDEQERLWDLRHVRIGNTFNNGEELEERTGEWEAYAEGLSEYQNYLPWNPASQRVLNAGGLSVDGWHRFAGQIVMQNVIGAAVTSSCYTNGIGTIYFDAVNGWADNVTNALGTANYRLEVEIATNTLYDASLPPTEENISSESDPARWDLAEDPFLMANWVRQNMRVLRFDDGVCTDLGMTNSLVLDVANGGSYHHFYRIIVPVDTVLPGRFRIVRRAIDPDYSLNPDGAAYILMDNVVCSAPTRRASLEPYGRYVATKVGKQILGWEGAFTPAFPSVVDEAISGRARVRMSDGSPYAQGAVSSAAMHYRWRYLDQCATDWKTVDFDLTTFTTREPLDLPRLQGDVEFWFDVNQNAGFYAYADYSGSGLGLGDSGYSEEVGAVTNCADTACVVGGERSGDWFVRLREGASTYAEMKLLIRGSQAPIDMQVTDNGLWSGYYRMTNAIPDGFWWRIESRDEQADGATTWASNTNRWYVMDWAGTPPSFPAAGRLTAGETNDWCRMRCDAQTGYLLFQVDPSSLGVTVIRADYQDFNNWNDAAEHFTGSSTEDGRKSGTSAYISTFTQSYDGWQDTISTNADWSLDFNSHSIGDENFPGYTTFTKFEDYFRGWQIGKGMWVYGKYRDPKSHIALQMAGSGEGYAEFSDRTQLGDNWPRGIEEVSYCARVAQPHSPAYAAFYDETSKLKDYTFMTRVCFDQKENKGFSGDASVSLFAYFRSGKGGYEARWEQIDGLTSDNPNYPNEVLGPNPKGQRLVLVRWTGNGTTTTYQETELIATTNSACASWGFKMPTMNALSHTNNVMPFMISAYEADGATILTAAVRVDKSLSEGADGGVGPHGSVSGSYWYFVTYRDESEDRPTRGQYGVLSSNCEGLFVTPQFRDEPTWPYGVAKAAVTTKSDYAVTSLSGTSDYESCLDDILDDAWSIAWNDPLRIEAFYNSTLSDPKTGIYGLKYVAPFQTVEVETKDLNDSDAKWIVRATTVLDGFGAPGKDATTRTKLYFTGDSLVRLKTGDSRVASTEVAIYDIAVRQWRGYDDWSGKSSESKTRQELYGRTNVVFTTGWITNGAVRLSAKRTDAGTACSIRSPLFDGYDGRKVGLGQLGITYREPQKNVRLKVQIVTNYTYSSSMSLKDMSLTVSESDSAMGNKEWYTLATLDYDTLMLGYDPAKKRGEWSMRLGYHGAKGMMRLVMDDELVQQVAGATDPDGFGEIDVLSFWCKDEPALDKGCWWGWNVHTIGDARDTQKRMYLADVTGSASGSGQSMALNNSIREDIAPGADPDDFALHMPFVQTPTFTNAVIGQISFRARKFELSDRVPDAKVVVYGATENPDTLWFDDQWTFIAEFPVTNNVYTTFTYKTESANFYAMRFAVVDVEGTDHRPTQPPKGSTAAQRVLLDEITVSEAVRAMLTFRNVGAFRSNLNTNCYVQGATTSAEQPLCDENWGIQAEVCATMLGDEIDKSYEPNVTLHWYVGKEPWGYANWKNLPKGFNHGSAKLAEAEGSNFVYRSSYPKAPDAVMNAQSEGGTVVQYMLEVEYQRVTVQQGKKHIVRATNWLDSACWTTPSWFAPVDYNTDPEYGAGRTFAGFTILDKVAPRWAWLNEVNIMGTTTTSGVNADEKFQYVEVCVPIEADLTGWRLRLLDPDVYYDTVTTNWIATFGDTVWEQAPGRKEGNRHAASNKVFRCLGNYESTKMRKSDGTLDGIWKFSQYTDTFRHRDGVDCVYDTEVPFGIQLVRPTGIIESSIVVVGTNRWGRMLGYHEYDPTNIVAILNRCVPGSSFFYAAEDCCGEMRSGSVTASHGENEGVWANDWVCTPGCVNTNVYGKAQSIDPDHPTPRGESLIIYATIDTSGGPIMQYVGGEGSTATNATEMIILKRGSARGTNILYKVAPWYELKEVTTNGVAQWMYKPSVQTYTATIGVGASNNITVVASAQVDSKLRDYGLTADNPYTPAVMRWLLDGTDAYGNPFKNPGSIALADFIALNDNIVTNMTLTQMYWLDMDPTADDLAFKAGMSKIWPEVENPLGEPVDDYRGQNVLTNVKMRVFMMITNRADGTAWTPYILRGLDPNFTSWSYTNDSVIAQTWTSETFKVTGILANGRTREENPDNWIPLRWFVFHEDSFFQPGNAENHEPFTTDIEIVDPRSISSPGAAAGWYDWCRDHGYTPVFNSWSIDTRLKPIGVEVLQTTNFYQKVTTP